MTKNINVSLSAVEDLETWRFIGISTALNRAIGSKLIFVMY